jgi:hypothetical protein
MSLSFYEVHRRDAKKYFLERIRDNFQIFFAEHRTGPPSLGINTTGVPFNAFSAKILGSRKNAKDAYGVRAYEQPEW